MQQPAVLTGDLPAEKNFSDKDFSADTCLIARKLRLSHEKIVGSWHAAG